MLRWSKFGITFRLQFGCALRSKFRGLLLEKYQNFDDDVWLQKHPWLRPQSDVLLQPKFWSDSLPNLSKFGIPLWLHFGILFQQKDGDVCWPKFHDHVYLQKCTFIAIKKVIHFCTRNLGWFLEQSLMMILIAKEFLCCNHKSGNLLQPKFLCACFTKWQVLSWLQFVGTFAIKVQEVSLIKVSWPYLLVNHTLIGITKTMKFCNQRLRLLLWSNFKDTFVIEIRKCFFNQNFN